MALYQLEKYPRDEDFHCGKTEQKGGEALSRNIEMCLLQLLTISLMICLSLAAAPGWSIWQGGMWNIPDDDNDNIPGVGGNDYPVNGQAQLCALNPSNPGC